MCGIAGIYNTNGEPTDESILARMSSTIGHRGPDGERFHLEGGVGLAHRALRIIDLSDAAIQPMTNEDGTLWLIFNGEVYNYIELRPELQARGHRFSSQSDSEVILHAYEEWGPDCLRRFNGMSAFALWDSRRSRLFIARDRLGVKPLYYSWRNRTLAFASEIKALFAHPGVTRQPHLPAVAEYMNAMFTQGEHTWFEGIKRLLPGHYMLADPDGLQIRRWWDLPTAEDAPGEHPEAYYIERTRELLEDSVRLRLRSDVPLGAHLSGGLDSSSIVALYSKQLQPTGEPVRTFSGAFAEGSAYDERRYVRAVVERYRTDHHETVPVADDLPRLFDRISWHMDEPTAGPGILLQYKVCEITRRAGVIVINGGQGGDEAWGGYYGYIPAYMKMLARQAKQDPQLATELAKSALALVGRSETRAALLKALASGRSGRLQASNALGDWAGPRFRDAADLLHAESARSANGASRERTPLAQAMYSDLKWYLPALLQVEDRMSMAFSLESRAPLLDYRLIEHASSVPGLLKLKGLEMKHIFREAVKDLLPTVVYKRTDKLGMPTPTSRWFRWSLAAWVKSEAQSESLRDSALLSEPYVQSALQEHLSGHSDRGNDLWKILNVAAWHRIFIANDPLQDTPPSLQLATRERARPIELTVQSR